MTQPFRWFAPVVMATILLIAACGGGESETPAEPPQIRALHPTFTSTPLPAQPPTNTPVPVVGDTTNNPAPAAQPTTAPADPNQQPAPPSAPIAVITEPQVNARQGPGTQYPVVQIITRGQQFDIKAKNAAGDWWQICCLNGNIAWVTNEFVDTDGAVDSLPVSDQLAPAVVNTPAPVVQLPQPPAAPAQPQPTTPPAQPTQPAAPAPTAPAPTAAPSVPAFEFDLLLKEQFPETNVTRVFLFVIDKSGAPIDGYSLRVTRNGAEVAVNAAPTFAGQPGLTWPIAGDRQRLQNFKAEFPGEATGGTWEVQLTRGGQAVGPVASFQLKDNDSLREMYVRYQKK